MWDQESGPVPRAHKKAEPPVSNSAVEPCPNFCLVAATTATATVEVSAASVSGCENGHRASHLLGNHVANRHGNFPLNRARDHDCVLLGALFGNRSVGRDVTNLRTLLWNANRVSNFPTLLLVDVVTNSDHSLAHFRAIRRHVVLILFLVYFIPADGDGHLLGHALISHHAMRAAASSAFLNDRLATLLNRALLSRVEVTLLNNGAVTSAAAITGYVFPHANIACDGPHLLDLNGPTDVADAVSNFGLRDTDGVRLLDFAPNRPADEVVLRPLTLLRHHYRKVLGNLSGLRNLPTDRDHPLANFRFADGFIDDAIFLHHLRDINCLLYRLVGLTAAHAGSATTAGVDRIYHSEN